MNKGNNFLTGLTGLLKKHMLTVTLALCGVALAALILWLGFLKTLLIVLLGAVGGAFGFWLDKRRQEDNAENSDDGTYFFG